MKTCKDNSPKSTRHTRRLAFALALAIAPVSTLAQELPALPTLPAFPADASSASTGQMEVPLPTPYPFAPKPNSNGTARSVVRLLGLNASKAREVSYELPAQAELPVLPPAPDVAPERSRNAVVASSTAAGNAPLRLNNTSNPSNLALPQLPPDVSLSNLEIPTGNLVVPAAATSDAEMQATTATADEPVIVALSDDPSVPTSKTSQASEPAKSELAAPLSLIDIPLDDLPTTESAAVTPLPMKPAAPIRPAVVQAPTFPELEEVASKSLELPQLPSAIAAQTGEGKSTLKLERLEKTSDGVRGDSKVERSARNMSRASSGIGEIALELELSDDIDSQSSQQSSFNLSDSSQSETTFSQVQPQRDTKLRPVGNLPGAMTTALPIEIDSEGDGTSLSLSDEAVAPQPMQIYVEGEAGFDTRAPRRVAGTPAKLAVSNKSSSSTRSSLTASPIHSGRSDERASSEHAKSETEVVAAKAIAVEATPPALSSARSAPPAVTGEMRQGVPMTLSTEDAVVHQADAIIRDLSVEHEHICRLIKTGPTTYSVLALQSGLTRIAVITDGKDGKQDVCISEVTVKKSANIAAEDGLGELARQISESLTELYPQHVIDVDVMDKSLLVQGEVGSEAEAKRVISLVRKASLVPVVDRLKSPEK